MGKKKGGGVEDKILGELLYTVGMEINEKSWASQGFQNRASKQAVHSSVGLRRQKSPVLFDHFYGITFPQDIILKNT